MERFKALEKEMKMKAFSKEGLIAQSRLDPAEKAKRDMVDWIGTTTDELSRQIEQTEAEAEALQTGKKKKAQGDRLHELDELNERRTWHTGRLEVVQRMLENGQLSTDQVEAIQEDVNYFVEANGVGLTISKAANNRRKTLTMISGYTTSSTCKTKKISRKTLPSRMSFPISTQRAWPT
jgi:CCR4-NOT transcriptional regulation complex NOT5 subunit